MTSGDYLKSYILKQASVIVPVGDNTSLTHIPVYTLTSHIQAYCRKYVHEVLVNRLGGLSLPRKSVVRLTDRPDMTLDVYRGRKTTIQPIQAYCQHFQYDS